MRRVLTSLNEKRIDLRRVFAQLGHRAGGIAGEPAAKDRPIEDLAEHVEDDVGSAIRELSPVDWSLHGERGRSGSYRGV